MRQSRMSLSGEKAQQWLKGGEYNMATVTKENIVVGSATLSVAGVGVGGTQGGVTLSLEKEMLDIPCDQQAGILSKHIVMERCYIATTMLEQTLNNLKLAMNEPAANLISGSQLDFGSASPTVTESVLTIVGKGPNGKTRTWTFYRATPADNVETSVGQRDAAGLVPVRFECLKDNTKNDKFGYVVETA